MALFTHKTFQNRLIAALPEEDVQRFFRTSTQFPSRCGTSSTRSARRSNTSILSSKGWPPS